MVKSHLMDLTSIFKPESVISHGYIIFHDPWNELEHFHAFQSFKVSNQVCACGILHNHLEWSEVFCYRSEQLRAEPPSSFYWNLGRKQKLFFCLLGWEVGGYRFNHVWLGMKLHLNRQMIACDCFITTSSLQVCNRGNYCKKRKC